MSFAQLGNRPKSTTQFLTETKPFKKNHFFLLFKSSEKPYFSDLMLFQRM